MSKSRNIHRRKKLQQKPRAARNGQKVQGIWPNLVPATDVYHPRGELVFVSGWQRESAAPKYADARWAAFESLCCQAVLPTRFTGESLCLAYRSSIIAAIYNTLKYDGRLQHHCGWLANEAFQLGAIAICRHAPKSLDRPTMPEHIGPDGSDVGPDLTDVASAYYRTLVERVLRKAQKREGKRRKRERRTATGYLQGERRLALVRRLTTADGEQLPQCRGETAPNSGSSVSNDDLHPDDEQLRSYATLLPKNARMPVAPPVVEDEEARYLKAEAAVTSACWTRLEKRIIALKEQGDLSDKEIGARVGKTGTQVNRAWHRVLRRAEETLGLDARECHRRKRRRDTPARLSEGRTPFWSVAWVSFHGNRRPDDPMPDTTVLFDKDGYKRRPLPRC
jgi:hypothetical protein